MSYSLDYKSALVIIPPPSIRTPLQGLRQQFEAPHKVRRWMPHITLFYPYLPQELFPQLAKELSPICASQQPFEITLSQVNYFSQKGRRSILWLTPEPQTPIQQLYSSLQQLPSTPSSRSPQEFTPHLTIGQAKGKRQRNDFINQIQTCWPPTTFLVDTIHMISREDPPNDIFQIQQTLPLGRD